MNRRRNAGIGLLAALLSGVLVYGLFQLQRLQVTRGETVEVVVAKQFVEAGRRLTEADIAYKRIPREGYEQGMLVDAKQAVGLETVIPLGTNEPILGWKIDKYHLLPTGMESTFQIPRDYVRSISNGIRAGDKVTVYLSGENEPSRRIFDSLVTVASVKSSSNVEIDNMKDPNLLSLAEGDKERMYASRRDANGMIEYINLNLTESQWLQIDGYCKDGLHKLVIAYSPESLQLEEDHT
ncbi:SAF domain-containing protein [Paenibacillus sp. MMO-177]|uniref:SAF domain-containing protein n=1 Tax=Paenibacillus sp. MMO-177 TaxID=3081289 RepID=UPI00301907B3